MKKELKSIQDEWKEYIRAFCGGSDEAVARLPQPLYHNLEVAFHIGYSACLEGVLLMGETDQYSEDEAMKWLATQRTSNLEILKRSLAWLDRDKTEKAKQEMH